MGKYKGFFIGKEKYFETEKIHELFIEMEVLDNNVKMDLNSNQTRFQPEVFKKEFKEEVFNEIVEVCKNIDVESECFNIKVQFENCLDSETEKIFLSKKINEYSKELIDSTAYFYYKKSEKEFRYFAIQNIGINEIYQYVHDELKGNISGDFYIAYHRILSNTLILEYLKTLNLKPTDTPNSADNTWSVKRKLLLFEKVLVMDWDNTDTTKKSHILSVLFDKNHHNIRKANQVLGKKQIELSKYEIQDMKYVNEFLEKTFKSDLNKTILYDLR